MSLSEKKPDLKWFTDRIDKRVYRDRVGYCDCNGCTDAVKNGIVIIDEIHAKYLLNISMEMGVDYRDKK